MAVKTTSQIFSEIYNETLESLWVQKVNLETYADLDDSMGIIPKEMVESGMRQQKTVSQRRVELKEAIKTKEKMLTIITKMLDEETDLEDRDTTG